MKRRWLIAHDKDNVGIALVALGAGERLANVTLLGPIAAGHKFALAPLTKGCRVIKLGHAIGIASTDIAAGDHVHTHNLGSGPVKLLACRSDG